MEKWLSESKGWERSIRKLSKSLAPRSSLSVKAVQGKGWPMQLLSVSCLSLAAKLEESTVPFLLNLQIIKPGFLLKPKTVQRMELLVMKTLKWRFNKKCKEKQSNADVLLKMDERNGEKDIQKVIEEKKSSLEVGINKSFIPFNQFYVHGLICVFFLVL